MNRLQKRLFASLNSFQRLQVLIKVINENELLTDDEKCNLILKLNDMSSDEINYTFDTIVENLEKQNKKEV